MLKKIALGLLMVAMCVTSGFAGNKLNLKDADIDFGIQYRVMYNNSNIGSESMYGFFRQRLRLNVDVHTEKDLGGFLQIEFRGGWGGSSPEASDPRGSYAVNVFNRLQARGIRYGYLYFPLWNAGKVQAGILSVNDKVDQMLFSADWDFNVGGIAYEGKAAGIDYRIAYLLPVEGYSFENKDHHFAIGDFNYDLGSVNVGVHYYGAYGKISDGTINTNFAKLNQSWIGPDFTWKFDSGKVHTVVIYNTGEVPEDLLSSEESKDTSGLLARVEGSVKLGPAEVSLLGLYSTGEDDGTGFRTVHGIFGTGGYWAYTYIFTPHGPSDVNDFGLEPGNKGYGLTTIQAKVDVPIIKKKLSAQAVAGYFMSNSEMGTTDKSLGTDIGAQLVINVGKNMNLELGGAIAFIGDAAKDMYQGNDKGTINEIFTRLQLEF